ncbi:MAG: hypothetical protein AAF098_19265, partial [Pseudomonadota bacterium]
MSDVSQQRRELSAILLSGVTVVQICTTDASRVALAAANFAGHLAAEMGAEVLVDPTFPLGDADLSSNSGKRVLGEAENPLLAGNGS